MFRQFYHRLLFTIRHPSQLAAELCARGVIDESTVVSACVCLLIDLVCFRVITSTVQQVAAQKGVRLARARLLLDAVERKLASERGREVLREFLRALMCDHHLRFLGEELALAANIVQGICAFLLMEVLLVYLSTKLFYKHRRSNGCGGAAVAASIIWLLKPHLQRRTFGKRCSHTRSLLITHMCY